MSNLVWTLDVDSRRSESLAGSVPYLPCQVFWASQKALGFYVKVTESSPTFPKQSEIRKMPYDELSKRITYIFFTENFCCHCWLFFLFCFYSTKPNSDKIYYPRVFYGNTYFDSMLRRHGMTLWLTKGLQLLGAFKFTQVLNKLQKAAKSQNQMDKNNMNSWKEVKLSYVSKKRMKSK